MLSGFTVLLLKKHLGMKQLHFFSGVTLTLFIGLHLFNHLYALLGMDQHIALMESLRQVYRNPVVETILLLAVGVQIYSGVSLLRRGWKKKTGFFQKVHYWSGLYLALFLVNHVTAVLYGRVGMGVDTNVYYGIAGLHRFPHVLFFGPYYALSILAFMGHISGIHATKAHFNLIGLSPKQQSWGILSLGFVLTFAIFYALTDGFAGVPIPPSYQL